MTKAKNPKSRVATFTTIALIAIAVILVAALCLVYVQSSGIILRNNTVLKTENYKVTGTMIQYLVNSQYQNFYSNYGAYASIFGLDVNKSLRDQTLDTSNTLVTSYLGLSEEDKDFKGTWFDYFWKVAEDQLRSSLVLCEAAKKAGVTLNDEDYKKIDDSIKALYTDMDKINEENRKTYEQLYGRKNYTTFGGIKDYLSASFGIGVSIKDIRNVLEIYTLSEKYYNQCSEEMLEELKRNNPEVEAYYNDHVSNYYKATFLNYTFSAAYTAPSDKNDTEKVNAAWNTYLEDINKAMDHAKALSECKTEEEFKVYLINYWFEKLWQTQYDKTITELKKKDAKDGGLTDADIPAKEVIEEKKAKALADIKDALLNEKKVSDMAPSGKTAYDGAIDAIRNSLFNTMSGSSYYGGLLYPKADYDDSTDEGKWLFDENRKPGDSKYFPSHEIKFVGQEADAPAATAEEETSSPENTEKDPNWEITLDKDKTEDKTFTVKVRYVIKGRHTVEETVREFGHILIDPDTFKSENKDLSDEEADKKAKEKAEELLKQIKEGELTKENFEAIATKNTADSGVFYEDVAPGDMVIPIDEWLFDENRKANDLEVVESEFGYHVMFMVSISDEAAYFVEARKDLYLEKLEKWSEENEKTYAVTTTADYAKKKVKLVTD